MLDIPIDQPMIVFGDLHLKWEALEVILEEASRRQIKTAFNLGDEDTFTGGRPEQYLRLFGALRSFRDDEQGNLVCVVGDKTAGIPDDLLPNYFGVDPATKTYTGTFVYRNGNVVAGHNGEWILDEQGPFIKSWQGDQPLVIFHGHSHYAGVLPVYKWLEDHEKGRFIPEGERVFELEPGKVYWINPGAPQPYVREFGEDKPHGANCAIYDPVEQIVILKTIFFSD